MVSASHRHTERRSLSDNLETDSVCTQISHLPPSPLSLTQVCQPERPAEVGQTWQEALIYSHFEIKEGEALTLNMTNEGGIDYLSLLETGPGCVCRSASGKTNGHYFWWRKSCKIVFLWVVGCVQIHLYQHIYNKLNVKATLCKNSCCFLQFGTPTLCNSATCLFTLSFSFSSSVNILFCHFTSVIMSLLPILPALVLVPIPALLPTSIAHSGPEHLLLPAVQSSCASGLNNNIPCGALSSQSPVQGDSARCTANWAN